MALSFDHTTLDVRRDALLIRLRWAMTNDEKRLAGKLIQEIARQDNEVRAWDARISS